MSEEPKIRLVVSKQRLYEELGCLQQILEEYRDFLQRIDPPADWLGEAQELMRQHWARLDRAKMSVQTLDLAGAVIRQVLMLHPGSRVVLDLADSSAAGGPGATADPNSAAAASAQAAATFPALVAEINALASNAPLAMQEKLRFLLGSLLRFVSSLEVEDIHKVEDILAEMNLLTSSRESQSVLREIALMAREIYDSIKAMSDGLPLDALTESTEGMSEAVRKLNGVIQRLEQAATQNLDLIEGLMQSHVKDAAVLDGIHTGLRYAQQRLGESKVRHPEHAAALEGIQERLANTVAAGIMHLRKRHEEMSDTHMALMAQQGFQDHTGSTLKRTIQFVESLQMQLMGLLEKYRAVLEMSLGVPDLSEPTAGEKEEALRQSQDQVDSLLANLGF
jgi:chemotaxis regulatin CheY-phosphate phosphatase CheZ